MMLPRIAIMEAVRFDFLSPQGSGGSLAPCLLNCQTLSLMAPG